MVTPGDARISGVDTTVRAPKRAAYAALGEALSRDPDYARGGGRSGGYVNAGGVMTTNGAARPTGCRGTPGTETSAGASAIMHGPIDWQTGQRIC